ncbi:MAG: glycosyltransferase family 9 protein [Verrucomicrobiota bacterium]|nr:glycosyltransferase family 9 protein [Verrucomicrobiota bacterium]
MWNRLVFFIFHLIFRPLSWVYTPLPQPLSKNPKSIVIFSTAGIGDSLTDSPAIRAIKETYPTAKVSVIAHKRRLIVARHNPFIDEVIPHRKNIFSFLGVVRRFRAQAPDMVIVLRANDPDTWPLAYLLNRHAVISCPTMTRYHYLISHPIPIPDWNNIHGVEQTLGIVAGAGATTKDPRLVFQISDVEKENVRLRFSSWVEKRYIVFQVGGGTRANYRDWPAEPMAIVINWVRGQGMKVILTGGNDNLEKAMRVQVLAGGEELLNLCGKMGLLETAEVVSRAVALVSTDTGVMHLGFAVGTPVVALVHGHNPASRVGPFGYGDSHLVIELLNPDGSKPRQNVSMTEIQPAQVIEKLAIIMKRNGVEVSS